MWQEEEFGFFGNVEVACGCLLQLLHLSDIWDGTSFFGLRLAAFCVKVV